MNQPGAEQRFQALLEQSLDAVALVEPGGCLSYVSPSIQKVLGYTPEEFLRLAPFAAVHTQDREEARRRFDEIIRQPGSSQTVINRVQRKDGSWRWIETVSINQLDNPAVRAIVANLRDVSDRVRMQEELRTQEQHFRLIVESATDFVIFTLGLDGRITSWNTGAERILGYTEEAILGQHVSVIFTPEDIAAGRVEFEMRSALYEGRENDDRWHVRSGGQRFWANGMMMPLKDERGNIHGYLKILRDRTQRKLIEDALYDANRRKDEFLAMLAHELRNPLAAISNAIHVLRSSASDDERQWSADVILRQTNQLRHMVDDLLDVSRITRGTIELRREPIDLATIITRALESVRSPLTEKATRVTVSLSPQPLVLMADPTRMEQVFVNLFGNAIKFTEERGHMEVTAYADADKTIVISVKDDGIGIDTSTLPQVFELFTQGRQATDRSVGGLGIGLTMVKRLVEMHGGEVTATSEGPGAGSEFTIRLPGSGEPLAEASAPKRTLSPEEMHRLRVLVVDDNQDTATGMAKLLSAAGHSVTTVYDGPSALEAARRERPDVMLLDIGLPGMSGYTVAAELRKEEQFKNTKIIALSGYGQAHDRRRSLEAGFDHHLVKPVDKDEVLELLARQLPLEPDQAEPSS